jgi:Fur family zinc uptake transcriptional regulator
MELDVDLSPDARHPDRARSARGGSGGDLTEAMAHAEAVCSAGKARLTPIRRRVFGTLQATHGSLGAYEIADALADDEGRRLAPITIYRALDFLIARGLAHRLASRNAYVACRQGHRAKDLAAFLICEGCGVVEERSARSLSSAASQLIDDARFQPSEKMLEISGRCACCWPLSAKAA